MPVAPSGPIANTQDKLRSLIAALPSFQAACGVATAGDALAHVALDEFGSRIATIAIASGVMTVTLSEPFEFIVGQIVRLDGPGLGSAAGTREIASVDEVQMPWLQATDDPWLQSNGQPWTFPSGEALTLTFAVPNLADLAEQAVADGTIFPCARPFAVVCPGESALRGTSIGTGGAATFSGELDILLEGLISPAYRRSATRSAAEANNLIGNFIFELTSTQGQSDYLPLKNVTLDKGPLFQPRAEVVKITDQFYSWQALVKVQTGLD